MSRPPKPVSVIKSEKKSHRTKAELEKREEGEKSLMSGKKLTERKEIKEDPTAHREYCRVLKIMQNINKDDECYSAVINRYCQLYSECKSLEMFKNSLQTIIEIVEISVKNLEKELEFNELLSLSKSIDAMAKKLFSIDSAVMGKRRMMFDIERENAMTVSSVLRSIPKEPEKQENPLLKALLDDD